MSPFSKTKKPEIKTKSKNKTTAVFVLIVFIILRVLNNIYKYYIYYSNPIIMKKRFQTKRIKQSIKFKRSKKNAGKHRKMSRKNGGTISPTQQPVKSSEFTWEKINEEILPFDSNKKYQVLTETFKPKIDEKIIYGKFWMKGCPYCDEIKEWWDVLVKELKTEYPNQFYNADFRQENVEEAKKLLKEKTGGTDDIPVNGYPTIYLIKNGKVNIYEKGGRTQTALKEWIISFLK